MRNKPTPCRQNLIDRLDKRPEIRTRDDLLQLISASVKHVITYANDSTTKALADHILREMRAAGLRIRQVKRRARRN